MDALADRARELQPDILVVDRTVHGRNENYRTPEQELPDERLPYPWESCITFTRSWCSFAPEEPTKPVGDAIANRSEEHTSELQSRGQLVCRLLLEKKKTTL